MIDLRKRFFGSDNSIQLVLFNVIALTGSFGGIFSLIMSLIAEVVPFQIILMGVSIVILLYCFYLANWKNLITLSSVVVTFLLTLVLFPVMFFTGGGIESGMGFWYCLGIIFSFLLLDKIWLWIIFALQLLFYSASYYFAYTHPEVILKMSSLKSVFIDTAQSLFSVSLIIGVIIKFQNHIYKKLIEKMEIKNKELTESEEKAEAANRAKSQFLSNISHEIRTPINSIIGMNEMILRESSDKSIIEYASIVGKSASSLLTLVNEVLDISKIESGKIELLESSYSLSAMLCDSYNMVVENAHKKNLEFNAQCSPNLPSSLYGDEKRIRQVIVNLLSNAVKYTEKGKVDFIIDENVISADSSHPVYKVPGEEIIELRFTVRDTGIGIREENMDKLFNKFERLDLKRNQSIEGTGLGLNIAKELCELMHGYIEVESVYGLGSVFTVVIPQIVTDKKRVGNVQFKHNMAQPAGKYKNLFYAPKARILAVDDVEMNLLVFTNLLKNTGVQIQTCLSGLEAIEAADKNQFDLIFMDYMMPQMNGIETFERIRNGSYLNKTTPVIMLTADAVSGVQDFYMEQGFDGYLSKPIDGRLLENMIIEFLPKNKIESIDDEALVKPAETRPAEEELIRKLKMNISGFDYESAIDFCSGDRKFFMNLFEKLVQKERFDMLEKYFEEKDWNNYEIEVHGLKSSLRTLGFTEAGALAEKLQFAASGLDINYIQLNHCKLMNKIEEIRKNI